MKKTRKKMGMQKEEVGSVD